jgi:hypothetical protein
MTMLTDRDKVAVTTTGLEATAIILKRLSTYMWMVKNVGTTTSPLANLTAS